MTIKKVSRTFIGHDGLTLIADCYGDENNETVLFAHGGGQTRWAWGNTAKAIAQKGYYAVAIDMRGHGESDWCPEGNYRLTAYADDLTVIAKELGRPIVVGASLGGLSSIYASKDNHGELFKAIVLVDVTPKMEREGVAKIIGFMGAKAEDGFASLEEAADAIATYLPHRKRPQNFDGLSKNLRLGEDGRYRWHWDPRFLKEDHRPGIDLQADTLDNSCRQLTIPVLLVRGQISDLVSEQAAADFLEMVPQAKCVDIANAGHMIAGDKNDVFSESVVQFIDSLDNQNGSQAVHV